MDKVAVIEAEIEQIDRDADTELSRPVPNLQKLEILKFKREAAVDRYDRALEKARVAAEVQDRQDRLKLDSERLDFQKQVFAASNSGLRLGNAVAGTTINTDVFAAFVLRVHFFFFLLLSQIVYHCRSIQRNRARCGCLEFYIYFSEGGGVFCVSVACLILNSILRCPCARNGRG